MRILVITSRYPPYHFGGYGIRCKNIMDLLSLRGHEIIVITSKKESRSHFPHQPTSYPVLRKLHVELKAENILSRLTQNRASYLFGMILVFLREMKNDLLDINFIDGQIKRFRPDVIYLGHIYILTSVLMSYCSSSPYSLIFDEGGAGLINAWKERGIWHKLVDGSSNRIFIPKRMQTWIIKLVWVLSANKIKPQWTWPNKLHVFFNSELNRKNTISSQVAITDAEVIHSGVDSKKFNFRSREKLSSPITIIVPGRIEPRKGQIDAVRLLAYLNRKTTTIKLLLVGERWNASYVSKIQEEIKKNHLEEHISFIPMVAQDELVQLYQQADICFFPSSQIEGFSRTPLEAMACGCIVISYGNEGSDEILRDRQNGFLAAPAEHEAVAEIINELKANPGMYQNILAIARNEIEKEYSIIRYVDQVEEFIDKAVGS